MPDKLKPRLVVLETPYKADSAAGLERNLLYARKCMHDCLIRGEYPLASHLLYTQPGILNDNDSEERQLGIDAGLAWGSYASKTVVYTDLGVSEGMQFGIEAAKRNNRPIEYRNLNDWP